MPNIAYKWILFDVCLIFSAQIACYRVVEKNQTKNFYFQLYSPKYQSYNQKSIDYHENSHFWQQSTKKTLIDRFEPIYDQNCCNKQTRFQNSGNKSENVWFRFEYFWLTANFRFNRLSFVKIFNEVFAWQKYKLQPQADVH